VFSTAGRDERGRAASVLGGLEHGFGVGLAWPWQAFLPATLYLLIHVVEGETITPMLLANLFTLNPVPVIVALFFWHTVWGVPGAILAVPLLATAKIICDRIVPLQPLGHVIGS
jgi:predicted PurR-regulated permease PerM